MSCNIKRTLIKPRHCHKNKNTALLYETTRSGLVGKISQFAISRTLSKLTERKMTISHNKMTIDYIDLRVPYD